MPQRISGDWSLHKPMSRRSKTHSAWGVGWGRERSRVSTPRPSGRRTETTMMMPLRRRRPPRRPSHSRT